MGKIKERVMKHSRAINFTRMQQLDQYQLLQRNIPFKRGREENLHNVEKLSLSWQQKHSKECRLVERNMPTYIEE